MADEASAFGGDSFGAMPAPPGKKGFFGGSKPAPAPTAEMAGLSEQISGLSARIRVSEERMNEIRNKMLFIEQNLLSNHKKLLGELKMSNEEIDELRHKLTEVEDRIITIIKELRLTARKTDIDVMKRYIELWDPVKFVSADFAEKIAREVVEEKLSGRASDQNI